MRYMPSLFAQPFAVPYIVSLTTNLGGSYYSIPI